jgi:hypothetical protein
MSLLIVLALGADIPRRPRTVTRRVTVVVAWLFPCVARSPRHTRWCSDQAVTIPAPLRECYIGVVAERLGDSSVAADRGSPKRWQVTVPAHAPLDASTAAARLRVMFFSFPPPHPDAWLGVVCELDPVSL